MHFTAMNHPWRFLLFLSAFFPPSAGHFTVLLRPLRVYSQYKRTAYEAVGYLAVHFNVSLHDGFEDDCDILVSTAQNEKSHEASLIILSDSNGVNCEGKQPWKDAIILNLSSGKERKMDGERQIGPPVVSSEGAKDINWEEYAKKLSTDSSLSSASLYQSFVHTTPLLTTTTRPKQEDEDKWKVSIPI